MNKPSNNFIQEDERKVEIYVIENLTTGKKYIGQAVTHILNHKKYRKYGAEGRFRCHISEAFSNKKNQSRFLNNAIKKYGVNDFIVYVIDTCTLELSDEIETKYIHEYNSLYPNGYNLTSGGKVTRLSDISKQKVSKGVENFYKNKKFEKFENLLFEKDINTYIKPLKRNNEQYGWYVYNNRIKADFGGVHLSLEESKKNAINFILELKRRHTLQRETPESPNYHPLLETISGDLG